MGTGPVTAAVADAGPLIHLNEIGCLALLQIFAVLHIPHAVWSETVGQARITQSDLQTLGNIHQHDVLPVELDRFVRTNKLEDLHAGERECLYVCQQIGVSVLLTDDLAAREAAKRLRFTPVGSLGIVVKAHRAGHISLSDAERHLADLHDISTLFVTRAIVELAIEQLHRWADQPE
jgi:predicted nucleic acid-binding protein